MKEPDVKDAFEWVLSIVSAFETMLVKSLTVAAILRDSGNPISDRQISDFLKQNPSIRDEARKLIAPIYAALMENPDPEPALVTRSELPEGGWLQ